MTKFVNLESSKADIVDSTSNWQRTLIRNYCGRKYRFGRSRLKWLLRKTLPVLQTVTLCDGLKMKLDITKSNQDFIFWFYEEIEPSLQWAINNLFPIDGVFVDCGANCGLFGLLAIHKRSAKCSLFIEPLPRLSNLIEENIVLNHFEARAEVFSLAASDSNGTADLHLYLASNDGKHTLEIKSHEKKFYDVCSVSTRRLENIFAEQKLEKVDFVKIDAEGHDYQVLKGLGDYLTPNRIPLLYVEDCGESISSLMIRRGYTAFISERFYIDDLWKKQSHELQGKAVAYFHATTNFNSVNYLWCPKNSEMEYHLNRIHKLSNESVL